MEASIYIQYIRKGRNSQGISTSIGVTISQEDTHQPFAKPHFHHLLMLSHVPATATKDQRLLLLFCFPKLIHMPQAEG